MNSLNTIILKEQLYYFLRFLEINDFIDLQSHTADDITKDDLIESIIFNFILDHYGDIHEI